MIYWAYNFLLTCALILSLPILPVFFLLGSRFREGLLQRFGFYPRAAWEPLKGTRPLWVHAVSVGEVLSGLSLASELKRAFPQRKILLSTFTSTGNRIARQAAASEGVIFLPLDHPWIVRRALNLFDPSALIFLETELWPNLIRLAHRRGIPSFLLSGRLSQRALGRYSLFRPFFSTVVQRFTAVGMQSREDAERMIRLGCDPAKITITGNLKFASLPEAPAANGDGVQGQSALDLAEGRQVLVVGSTHRGEEELLLDAFVRLKTRFPALTMVLAPRHPQRFYEVERLLKKKGVRYEKRSQFNGQGRDLPDVLFLDTLGELPAFYAMADVAFVGGSLVNAGGHNLMEPARCRKPILFGPYVTNFLDIAEEMKRRGGGIEVKDKEDLIRTISALLTDRTRALEMGGVAYAVVQGDRGVLARSLELVSPYLLP